MEATILNKDFEVVGIIDTYKSFIWTVRFDEYGDFEIYIPIGDNMPTGLVKGNYIWVGNSDRLMIIESMKIETDQDEIPFILISGRSLESILKRRIVWNKRVFYFDKDTEQFPNLQDSIKSMLEENIGSKAANVSRRISNFIFRTSDDPKITKLYVDAEYLGEELYDVVSKLCKENEIGFRITYHETYTHEDVDYENAFVFELIAGVDRSYGDPDNEIEQTENPYVVFSHVYENIFGTSYLDSDENLKNVTLVVGESQYDEMGNEISRVAITVENKNQNGDEPFIGLDRREVFTDATSLSMEDENGNALGTGRYEALLRQKGIDTLIDNTTNTAFEGEVDPNNMYIYGEDYFIGDIVQVENEYGYQGRAYISEYVISCDENGMLAYPTFKAIQKGVYETTS